jgi:selenocysteine lyase/cysteine desulfurase
MPMRPSHADSLSRRSFLAAAALTGVGLALPTASTARPQSAPLSPPDGSPDRAAADEAYWRRVAAHYQLSDRAINLEAGYWGVMSVPVHQEYLRQVERVNRESSLYARRTYAADLSAVRARVARLLGVTAEEIAFARSATESLQCLIGGYNRLAPGDTVLYADLDYPAMQNAMKWLAERRGVRVVRLVIPEPATYDNVLGAYDTALKGNPGVKLLLLTHVNNKTGLVTPVREVSTMARAHGADTIVDAAHSVGQMQVSFADLGADFIGCNLHKWIGAPLGVGVFYVRKGRLDAIDRMMGDEESPADSILSRVTTGTTNFAAFLTVPNAIDFHESIGPAHKAARLRYLRDRWVRAVRGVSGIDVLTPDDPRMSAGITSFRLKGATTRQQNDRIVEELLTRYGIFTARRTGLERGDCVRVTPALYTSASDVDALATALQTLAR